MTGTEVTEMILAACQELDIPAEIIPAGPYDIYKKVSIYLHRNRLTVRVYDDGSWSLGTHAHSNRVFYQGPQTPYHNKPDYCDPSFDPIEFVKWIIQQ